MGLTRRFLSLSSKTSPSLEGITHNAEGGESKRRDSVMAHTKMRRERRLRKPNRITGGYNSHLGHTDNGDSDAVARTHSCDASHFDPCGAKAHRPNWGRNSRKPTSGLEVRRSKQRCRNKGEPRDTLATVQHYQRCVATAPRRPITDE